MFGVFVVALLWAVISAVSAQAADLYAFSPPPAWPLFTQTNYPDRADADWRGPASNGFAENVLVIVRPTTESLDGASSEKAIEAGMPGSHATSQRMTVCGGHAAVSVYITGPWHGSTLVSEQVLSIWSGTMYQAVYSRLSGQQTMETARSSLVTLCPPGQSRSTSW